MILYASSLIYTKTPIVEHVMSDNEQGSSGAGFSKEQQEQWKLLMASAVTEALAAHSKEQANQTALSRMLVGIMARGSVACCACNETAWQDKGSCSNGWALNAGRVLVSAGISVAGARGGLEQ